MKKKKQKRKYLKLKKKEEKQEDDAFQGYIERYNIPGVYYCGKNQKSRLVEFGSACDCFNSIFIEGLSGVGISASVVSAYIVGYLKLPLVAVFESVYLPAMSSIDKYCATSAIRIYGNANVCVALGDHQVSPVHDSELMWDMARSFTGFAKRHRCTHIITIDGYPVKDEMQKQIQSIAKMIPQKDQSTSGLDYNYEDNDDSETIKTYSDEKKKKITF